VGPRKGERVGHEGFISSSRHHNTHTHTHTHTQSTPCSGSRSVEQGQVSNCCIQCFKDPRGLDHVLRVRGAGLCLGVGPEQCRREWVGWVRRPPPSCNQEKPTSHQRATPIGGLRVQSSSSLWPLHLCSRTKSISKACPMSAVYVSPTYVLSHLCSLLPKFPPMFPPMFSPIIGSTRIMAGCR
jgi:hypothetical protein